jgi:urease accessory protein
MTTDLLTLVQWLSPAFPTGAFAYAHGLEVAMSTGLRSPAHLTRWIADVLEHGAGRTDALLLAQGLRADADHAALDDLACAMAPSRERLAETLAQGAAFARTVGAISGRPLPARALPVAVAEASAMLDLAPAVVIGLYMHGFAANLASIATRFVPLGQTAGQQIVADLHPLIDRMATWAAPADLSHLGSFSLGADMASMAHETLDVRLFKT